MRYQNPISDLRSVYERSGIRLRKADPREALRDIVALESEVAGFLDKLGKIAEDPRLTGEGKADAARTAGRELLDRVDKWATPKLDGLKANETAARTELHGAVSRQRSTDPARAVEDALLRSEIRRSANGLADDELERLFANGDGLIRDALLERPRISVRNGSVMVRPFVRPEVADALLIEDAEGKRPDLADRLADLAELRDLYTGAAGAVRRLVAEVAPSAVEASFTTLA
ncbi:MAG: hypothetical protein KJ067_14590 [Vicinamibacteria bacterium]|nr:hypothetical protein [Vicinamibacteria bacterium]